MNAGPFHVAYVPHLGSYKKFNGVLQQFADSLERQGLTGFRSGGIFYDDPQIAGEDKCRSEAIAILTPAQMEKLRGNPAFKTKTLERRHYLHTAFPYRGSLSVLAGARKVYPLYKRYFSENKLAAYKYRESGYENEYGIEIYGPEKILYYMTFNKGDL